MRLKNLRLSGFKSFVEPTNVLFPSNLTSIVGPNGCGKSNIIDAVRWVMGESSATRLRGESMADVIFNGSTNRAPVGQASVELVFDNAQGKLGGEYAQYNEIGIKRVVNRDGQSTYFLNNTECRRRDIRDIFLGTGLGPRSYSIIEQGMISRFIEAKPEDLRVFIEEVAGISKYKERRRETANRIQHTRENLERLSDIRQELDKQIERLQRQAKAAEKYTELKAQARCYRAQLQALKFQTIQKKLATLSALQTEQELLLEARRADQQRTDRELETQKQNRHDASASHSDQQQIYYSIAAEIARLEQAIASQQERRAQLVDDAAQAQAEFDNLTRHQAQDSSSLQRYTQELTQLQPQAEQAQARYTESRAQLQLAEDARTDWQVDWDNFNTAASEASKQAHVEQTRIQHLEAQLKQSQTRLDDFNTEANKLCQATQASALVNFAQVIDEHQAQKNQLETRLQTITAQLTAARAEVSQAQQALDQQQQTRQTQYGRQASLNALQQAALGKDANGSKDWLSQQQLATAPRLAEGLDITPGWERALETVLGQYLQAVWVESIRDISAAIGDLTQGSLTLLQAGQTPAQHSDQLTTTLLSQIQQPSPVLTELLAGVYITADLTTALNLQAKLTVNESIITQEGIWLGRHWLRVTRDVDVHHGVIVREQELQRLQENITATSANITTQQAHLTQLQEKIAQLEQQREDWQQQLAHNHRQLSESQAEARITQNQQTANEQRLTRITSETQTLKLHYSQQQTELNVARETWQQLMQTMETDASTRDGLMSARESINQRLDEARDQTNQYREDAHNLSLANQNATAQLQALQQNLDRMQSRLGDLTTRIAGFNLAIAQADNPAGDLSQALAQKLTAHATAEHSMHTARSHLEAIEEHITDLEHNRHALEAQAREVQSLLDQTRLEAQTFKVRLTTIEETLAEMAENIEAVRATLPPEANESAWEQQQDNLEKQIQRLGAINLAAIEEYQIESERKRYLDSQHDDLAQALQTLEAAIAKIDKETKQKFRETFDIVNNSFKSLFPKLFGGGHAFLALTDDDLLTTGITVMAQPPGKRNSTIHLLSGGEKAMTAVALVFSIFQLNPSPFCMLDEVDAPLDDANVERFCRLVGEMSKTIQFIIITHNKVTMELAQHLAGVTMHEPGVSRLVSVDVAEAISLVQEEQ